MRCHDALGSPSSGGAHAFLPPPPAKPEADCTEGFNMFTMQEDPAKTDPESQSLGFGPGEQLRPLPGRRRVHVCDARLNLLA